MENRRAHAHRGRLPAARRTAGGIQLRPRRHGRVRLLLDELVASLLADTDEQLCVPRRGARTNSSPTRRRAFRRTSRGRTTTNRDAALAYAAEWTDETRLVRSPDWDIYDDYGGNCANFTSQVLYAGGIPMDYSGSAQWKYYESGINTQRRPVGRSTSWTGVGSFREYAYANTGSGLVAWVDANPWAAQPGDILQVGVYGGARHAVVVTEVVYDESGAPVDYLLASNTTDHVDFPASAYVYTSWIVIQILGWND